jgi:ATP-dependent Lon protease
MRLLAQWILNPTAKGMVLGLHGPPGVGKTALCKAVCRCLGLPFAFIPLGGAHDASVLDGHSFTYEGSTWGKISDVLMKAKCMNPVLYFDELDKLSETKADVANLLIHLTDPTQNEHFGDKYFMGVNLDLSRCLVIFSYNDESIVHPVLKDRIVAVRTEPYTASEKAQIAASHLLPDILEEFGLPRDALGISHDALHRLVSTHASDEGGVRSIKRALHEIVSHLNYARATRGGGATGLPGTIEVEHVESMTSPPSQSIPKHVLMSMYS